MKPDDDMPDTRRACIIMLRTLNLSMSLAIALVLLAFWMSGALR